MSVETNIQFHEFIFVGRAKAALVEWEHVMEVVLVQQMTAIGRQENTTHEAIGDTRVVQDTELSDEISTVGVVFDVPDYFDQGCICDCFGPGRLIGD
jgi:hypothetical protein